MLTTSLAAEVLVGEALWGISVSYLYVFYAPWMWLYTVIAFRKEKDPAQRKRNREILATLFSPAILFGENLLLVARKV